MIKSLSIIVLIFFSIIGKSQDTIIYRNAAKLVVNLVEISQTEVKYRKLEIPDGPMYIINKNDIEKIIYKNGVVETINTAIDYSPTTVVTTVSPGVRKLYYRDTKMGYRSLVKLIDQHPNIKKRDELYNSALSIKRLKNSKNGTLGAAIAFGALALGGAFVYEVANAVTYSGAGNEFILPPVVFGVCAVALCAATVTLDLNLRKKRKSFVNAYNDL